MAYEVARTYSITVVVLLITAIIIKQIASSK